MAGHGRGLGLFVAEVARNLRVDDALYASQLFALGIVLENKEFKFQNQKQSFYKLDWESGLVPNFELESSPQDRREGQNPHGEGRP